MRGSLKITKLFGVPVLLHWSFAIVPVVVFFLWKKEDTGTEGLLWLALFSTCLFLSILLHEYGHALMARRFGVETKDIILLPIGGLARLTRLPERPWHELLVAIAGPLVNILIALLLLPHLVFVFLERIEVNALPFPENITEDFSFFLPALFGLNLLLAIFNLIPAFPMDGGRVLRALLSMKFSRVRATWVAATLGQIIAAGMVVFAIVKGRPSYSLIGAFIFVTARREYSWVKTESLLKAHTVGESYRKVIGCIGAGETWGDFLEQKNKSGEGTFLVFDSARHLVGFISESAVEEGHIPSSPLGEIAKRAERSIHFSETLKQANEKMQKWKCEAIWVSGGNETTGVLEEWMIWEHLEKMEQNKK